MHIKLTYAYSYYRSFGILVWEVATYGKTPFHNVAAEDIIEMASHGSLKPTRLLFKYIYIIYTYPYVLTSVFAFLVLKTVQRCWLILLINVLRSHLRIDQHLQIYWSTANKMLKLTFVDHSNISNHNCIAIVLASWL